MGEILRDGAQSLCCNADQGGAAPPSHHLAGRDGSAGASHSGGRCQLFTACEPRESAHLKSNGEFGKDSGMADDGRVGNGRTSAWGTLSTRPTGDCSHGGDAGATIVRSQKQCCFLGRRQKTHEEPTRMRKAAHAGACHGCLTETFLLARAAELSCF
eukprot:2807892-Pleurochrysis_carterae.AAC.9